MAASQTHKRDTCDSRKKYQHYVHDFWGLVAWHPLLLAPERAAVKLFNCLPCCGGNSMHLFIVARARSEHPTAVAGVYITAPPYVKWLTLRCPPSWRSRSPWHRQSPLRGSTDGYIKAWRHEVNCTVSQHRWNRRLR